MANVGDKYIIEIDEVFHGDVVPDTAIYEDHELYRIKGFNSLVFDENGLNKLEKYKENPFTQSDCDRARQEGYEQGLNDAWEAAYKIAFSTHNERNIILGTTKKNNGIMDIFQGMTPSEAIAKIKAYEEQKKAEEESIKVGDEVESGDTRYIVVRVYNDTFEGIGACGADMGLCLSNFHKTGRHFSQIAEVLEKMKEN